VTYGCRISVWQRGVSSFGRRRPSIDPRSRQVTTEAATHDADNYSSTSPRSLPSCSESSIGTISGGCEMIRSWRRVAYQYAYQSVRYPWDRGARWRPFATLTTRYSKQRVVDGMGEVRGSSPLSSTGAAQSVEEQRPGPRSAPPPAFAQAADTLAARPINTAAVGLGGLSPNPMIPIKRRGARSAPHVVLPARAASRRHPRRCVKGPRFRDVSIYSRRPHSTPERRRC